MVYSWSLDIRGAPEPNPRTARPWADPPAGGPTGGDQIQFLVELALHLTPHWTQLTPCLHAPHSLHVLAKTALS